MARDSIQTPAAKTGCRMEFWINERQTVKNRISEIESKIALLHTPSAPGIARPQRIAIMRDSLSRAKLHADYIERRIAAHQSDAEKRAAQSQLIKTLTTNHSPPKSPRPITSQ
jgi:hypothetical protein